MTKKIISDDKKAEQEHRTCAYCQKLMCTSYYYPRNRIVCSGILPQWEFLWFLMREVKVTDTCKNFVRNKVLDEKER